MPEMMEEPRVDDAGSAGLFRQAEREFLQILESADGNPDIFFVLGLIAHRDGRHGVAVEQIARAIALGGTDPDYHYYLGASLLALGQHAEAEVELRHALLLRPDHAEAHHDLGRLCEATGRLVEAEASYRRALERAPEGVEALARLGAVLAGSGRPDEAAACYARAVQLRSDDARLRREIGGFEARRSNLDAAAAHFARAVQLQPDDADLHNELGIIYARQGRHEEAAASYREAIRLRPDFPDAHNNLGNALRSRGKVDEAIASFREALRLRPEYPEAHNNLGIALRHKGQVDEAISSYLRALRLRPGYAEAHNNLGIALAGQGKHDGAIISYQQALRLRPEYVEAHVNLGNALADQGKLDLAITAYREAIRLRPDDPKLHKNLGIALSKREKYDEAIASYREALRLRPEYADAHNDLGIALSRREQYDEAIASYREALRCRPHYAETLNNLGNALRHLGKFDEAIASYQQALKAKPTYADAYNNLGIAYAEAGRFADAVESYTQCLKLRPNHVDAHMNRALTWLRMGEFGQGWAEYEWRWRKRSVSSRPLIQPLWNGAPLRGRRILLVAEQGLGDTLHFIRYAPLLKAQGATVIFECPERLVKVLARTPGIDQMYPQGQQGPPEHDVYAPLLTLPGLLGTSLDDVPTNVPYVHPDPDLVEYWRRELADVAEFKVGINWQGNPGYGGDRHRSIPLACFEPLARVPGVKLFSLQKNHGSEQLETIRDRFEVVDLGRRLDEQAGPFMDTAAVMKNLDLFITSDTAVVHLAGALGVPVWVAMSASPGWPWLAGREDSPWYPTMRLFRQAELMNWPPVFERIARALRALVPPPAGARSVAAEIPPGELLDRIVALEVKAERLAEPDRLRSLRAELATLRGWRERSMPNPAGLGPLVDELRAVVESLWYIDGDLRDLEAAGAFDEPYVALARRARHLADRRADLRRQINGLLGSDAVD